MIVRSVWDAIYNSKIRNRSIENILKSTGLCICEIKMHSEQSLFPKSATYMDKNGKMASEPLEKMFLFVLEKVQKEFHYSSKNKFID